MRPPLTRFALIGAAALSAATFPSEGGRQAGPALAPAPAAAQTPRSVTVPLALDHNRMTVEVEFVRADGTLRKAQAWVDLGSEFVVVGEPLARDLGLDLAALQKTPKEAVESAPPSPPLRVGGLALDVSGIKVLVRPGTRWRPGVVADAMLPASALRHDHVVFDYPARRMTIAQPGALEPRGVAVPCRVNEETGLLQVDATVDGRTLALGVDNGSAGTWVSSTLTRDWLQRHPDWPHAVGAAGSANFWGISLETTGTLMSLPGLSLSSMTVRDIALLGIGKEIFDWYSTKSAGPVVGFIGANVLRRFRLEIDYPGRMTYWEAGAELEPRDLDIVGMTIRAERDGSYTVAGVTTKNGKPTVEGVEVGDALLRVGSLNATNAAMGAVVDSLRGRPGDARTLLVGRQGNQVSVETRVARLP